MMNDQNFANIATRMFGAPLMVEPSKGEIIASSYGPRLFSAPVVVQSGGEAIDADWRGVQKRAGSILAEGLTDYAVSNREGYIKHGGVAVIEVIGSLVRRGAWLGQSSGMTSYEGLRAQLKAAAADADIKAIALEFDSPGGEAAGAFELADLVREINQTKPVYGFCAEYAYSAAYALASQCRHLTVPEFGGAGSIGVIMMHADQSKALEKDGLQITIIRSGEKKAEGNSVEPLPEALRDEWQSECDAMRVNFAQLVGLGRGDRFDMAAALKTEAKAYGGRDAVALGLADAIADPKKAFDAMVASINATGTWDGSIPDPDTRGALGGSGCEIEAVVPLTEKEGEMPDKLKEPDGQQDTGKNAGGATAGDKGAEVMVGNPDASAILAAVSRAGLSAAFANELVQEGLSYAAASDKIIDKLAQSNADGGDIINGGGSIQITGDGVDRMKAGMTKALLAKAGHEDGERNEFSAMSLREMARASLETRNLTSRFNTALELVGAAFVPSMAGGMHSTSDFGAVLADVANKQLLRGYREREENFELFTKRTSVADFKPTSRVGTGLFPTLDEVGEGAEFSYGTMGDFSESVIIATYGKLFAISRQSIINDDLSAFTEIPLKAGRAAKRTVAGLVYAILNQNPNMGDGVALFASGHNNLAASGAVPSEASIDAALVAMAQQKPRGTQGDDVSLNIRPKYLIAPDKHRSAAISALKSEKTPDTAGSKSSGRVNTVYEAAELILDSRITGNKWFMAADPSEFDTIEVAYLDGVNEPYIDQQNGWTVDGVEFKARIDAGAKAVAWEGLYQNPGA